MKNWFVMIVGWMFCVCVVFSSIVYVVDVFVDGVMLIVNIGMEYCMLLCDVLLYDLYLISVIVEDQNLKVCLIFKVILVMVLFCGQMVSLDVSVIIVVSDGYVLYLLMCLLLGDCVDGLCVWLVVEDFVVLWLMFKGQDIGLFWLIWMVFVVKVLVVNESLWIYSIVCIDVVVLLGECFVVIWFVVGLFVDGVVMCGFVMFQCVCFLCYMFNCVGDVNFGFDFNVLYSFVEYFGDEKLCYLICDL